MVPQDVRFCVEDITDGDPRRVGVRWCAAWQPAALCSAICMPRSSPAGCPMRGPATPLPACTGLSCTMCMCVCCHSIDTCLIFLLAGMLRSPARTGSPLSSPFRAAAPSTK